MKFSLSEENAATWFFWITGSVFFAAGVCCSGLAAFIWKVL